MAIALILLVLVVGFGVGIVQDLLWISVVAVLIALLIGVAGLR